MGLTPQFTKADIKNFIKKKVEGYRKAMEMRLQRAGEEFIILCKESGTYKDRTGNLRNAPFYLVLHDGKRVGAEFGQGKAGSKSKAFAEKVSSGYTLGYALICGDGMEYAAAVESRGKEVITGSTQTIETRLRDALKRIKDK